MSFLEDNLRVARKDRENLQLDVAKGLKEFVKDYPATAIRFMADEKYVEENDKLNKEIGEVEEKLADLTSEYYELENLKNNEIAELKREIEVKDIQIKELQEQKIYWKESSFDWRHNYFKLGKVKKLIAKDKKLSKAKEIIKNIIRVTWGEGWNYSLQVKVEAEKFLKECE